MAETSAILDRADALLIVPSDVAINLADKLLDCDGLPVSWIEEFRFQPSEEAFARCVILGTPLAGHQANQFRIVNPSEPAEPTIMRSAIGMDNCPAFTVGNSFNGGVQHCIDQTRVRLRSNRPADHHPVEAINDGREIYFAGWDLEFGNVRELFLVRCFGMEVAVDQFSGAGLISPRYEAKRRRRGLAATRRSCFIDRCTTFSEIVTLCRARDVCSLR